MVISATAFALRPGARRTGIPAFVAPATSTLLGSPRHDPIQMSGRSKTGPLTESDSTTSRFAALGLDPGGEFLAVVETQGDLLDPRVVHDLGQGLQGVHALTAEWRGDERSGSIRHVRSSIGGFGCVLGHPRGEGDGSVRFGGSGAGGSGRRPRSAASREVVQDPPRRPRGCRNRRSFRIDRRRAWARSDRTSRSALANTCEARSC